MTKINLTSRRLHAIAGRNVNMDNSAVGNVMLDPRYLRQSSTLIQDALQKGFDVLQHANGEIIMTGIKTVVYQYSWDEEKGKLVKAKPERKPRKLTAPALGDEQEPEQEIEQEPETEDSEEA